MLRSTGRCLAKEMTYVEVWEHFKRFGDAAGPGSVTCRLLCAEDVAARLNERMQMRYLLEQFLVRCANPTAAGVGGEPKRWWHGDLSRTANGDRRVMSETLLEDGWELTHLNSCISEREWIITTMTFMRERRTEKHG
ncbi:hypothetical protein ERJ75_001671100 [Trypanosoma vivax]|uniref:Uncharacterized protein n=1 Tax=Trypanosoma vivax (strain Y486) TaxID=1055687 RepID=G0U8N3_TRYVY|nr:hypothetical protein TRVL_03556 [Trypanosoma vivax]KAH8605189.1 hypothetical protein ERJ75_001671100 [Trypanosoma vivax]CCC53960.1 conserved hypothetical protein [Trypanosoma vivax Y486]